MESLRREQVRALDRCAIETVGIPGAVLMENAGRQAADRLVDLLGGSAEGHTVGIVAGAGNNGGDAFVIARHLLIRGATVATYLVVPEQKVSGDAELNLSVLRRLGGEVIALGEDDLPGLADRLRPCDAVVDGVGGTGIEGALRGGLARAVEAINAADRPVLAVDIPTGLDCDTGEAPGPVVRAAVTVTFLARKTGFDNPAAAEFTGRVHVADIGIPPEIVRRIADSGS